MTNTSPFTPWKSCFRRSAQRSPPPSLAPDAEHNANILSRLSFTWIYPLIARGCLLPLQQSDLPPLMINDRSETVAPIFHQAYQRVAHADRVRESKATNSPSNTSSQTQTDQATPTIVSHRHTPSPPSDSILVRIAAAIPARFASRTSRALFSVTGFPFIKAALWKPVYLASAIGQVYAIRALVHLVTDSSEGPQNIYILVVIAMTFCSVLMSLSQHAIFSCSMRAGMRARAAVSSVIYRKTLRLDPSASAATTDGELTNLLVNDSQRILDSYSYFHFCWFGFIEILVTSALLTIDLGVSAFFGVGVLILLVPAQIFFSILVSRARTHISKESDIRVQTMTEILSGIRIVKLSTWEPHFKNLVASLRNKEVRHLKVAAVLRAMNAALFFAAPVTVALATFTAHTLVFGRELTPKIVFSSMAFFSVLSRVLTLMPLGWLAISEAGVASRRLDSFFNLTELPSLAASQRLDGGDGLTSLSDSLSSTSDLDSLPDSASEEEEEEAMETPNENARVQIKRAQFSHAQHGSRHDRKMATVLTDINISVGDAELVSIVGPVGSGKSSLLLGILGEILCSSGSVRKRGRVAYCAQQPWIINGTVRENITMFGAVDDPDDRAWYDEVVDCCCLRPDLRALPAGDKTEIGERGVNLSGGQKARVALARAVYSRADSYLLDDPLSAVDSAVASRLLKNVFGSKGLLASKTQIMVTHQLHVLPLSTSVVVLGGGTVCHEGSFEKLRSQGVEFSGFAGVEDDLDKERSEVGIELDDSDDDAEIHRRHQKESLKALLKDVEIDVGPSEKSGKKVKDDNAFTIPLVKEGCEDTYQPEEHQFVTTTQGERLIADEDRRVGRVNAKVYRSYVKAGGGYGTLLVVAGCFALAQAVRQVAEVWLGKWSTVSMDGIDHSAENRFYALVFFGLTLGTAALTLMRAAIFAERTMVASRRLHDDLLERVLHAAPYFFETNPIGRILNRFSKDIDQMDVMLPITSQDFLQISFVAIGALATISAILPWFLIPIVPIALSFIYLQRMYKMSSRELKRIDGVSRSPIYAQYVETCHGLSTVRAYDAQSNFTTTFNTRVNDNHRAYHMFASAGRWLGVRLDALTSLVVFCTSLVVLLQRSNLDPGLAGVALTQSILMTGIFQWGVRQAAETENLFTSVERVSNMATQTPVEKDYYIPDKKPPSSWPCEGIVSFDHVELKYRPELDPALRDLSFKTNSRERVGIVGRTGSGKSSLFVALFRMVELTKGTIAIDDRDISELGLHDLRSKMAIVPQDPVLFNGTIRSNLDPTGLYDDASIWDALHRVHMSNAIQGITGSVNGEGAGLDLVVHEKGSNFSAGERQLLSLARAILSGVRIVVLDEASASLDNHTDMLIQKTVREQLSDRTVLTIAHRLATVADSDRILVIEAGEVVEFDTPANLMSKKGYFARLVEETGKLESAILKAIIAEASGQKGENQAPSD